MNSALIETAAFGFPNDRLEVWGCESHLQGIKDSLRNLNPGFHSISISSKGTKGWHRLRREFLLMLELRRRLKREKNSIVLFLSTNPSLCRLSKALLSNATERILFVLHGKANQIVKPNSSRSPLHWFWGWRRSIEATASSEIRFAVLEQSIRDELIKCVPSMSKWLFAIDHPIPNIQVVEDVKKSPTLNFGFVGLAANHKGFSVFCEAAKSMQQKWSSHVQFSVIGRRHAASVCDESGLTVRPIDEPIQRDDFERSLNRLDYVVMPYSAEHYMLSASGVLLDAIAFQIPVIVTRLPMFESLFQRYGDIGHLIDKPSDCELAMRQIVVERDLVRYERQRNNLKRIAEDRTPEILASSLKHAFDI